MDENRLRPYVLQVIHQADLAMLSAAALDDVISSPTPPPPPAYNLPAFAAVQGLVTAAHQITQLLWPRPITKDLNLRAWAVDRGDALRAVVAPIDEATSPLGSRKLRDTLQHLDERLDKYLFEFHQAPRDEVMGDWHIGPRVTVLESGSAVEYVRHIDTGGAPLYVVLGEETDIQQLWDEVQRVGALAVEWMNAHP